MFSIARCLIVLVGLCLLASDMIGNARFRLDKFVAVPLRGTTWHHWRVTETAMLVGVTANLEQCTGPVLTFHGQDSLAIWASKSVIEGHSSPHYLARYRPSEIDRSLALFRDTASWSAVVFAKGGVYPRGNAQSEILWNQINDFVAERTRPWLQIGNYVIKLSLSAPEPQPVNVVWKSQGRWKMNAPVSALRSALKARLRTNGRIAGNFSWHAMEPSAELAVPDEIARLLESARTTDDASLWLCDGKWMPLAMLPVAKLLLK